MNLSPNCPINLPVLLETRALVVANSGGGKSYALRRLLEQTAPHVQQIVIDPEGEFATLREKFDYVIAAPHDGDALASVKTAAVLARRLMETGVSAIIDIYDMPAHERQRFVKLFLDALVNAPRELWHPVMIVLDEAHVFCPQNGDAEAQGAVTDVATRGRKRGQCLVLATQRLSKLHKDTAAEMINKLIGRTSIDVDRKRAADELGMTAKEAVEILRRLEPGEFYALGPALTGDVTKIKIGKVATSHPKPGDRLMKAPPAPSPAIRKQLAKLADLQKVAEEDAKTTAGLMGTVARLKDENAQLKRSAQKPVVDKAAEQLAFDSGFAGGQVEAEKYYKPAIAALQKKLAKIAQLIAIEDIAPAASVEVRALPPKLVAKPDTSVLSDEPYSVARRFAEAQQPLRQINGDTPQLRSGARRILQELAARHPAGYSKPQVGALTKFSHRGGTFNTYLSDLRRSGFIVERDSLLFASDAGIAVFGDKPPSPTTHAEMMAQWNGALRSGAFKMLQQIVEAREDGLHRANLADLVNMTAAGGTFNTYLSDLRRNGLIEERGKRLFANDILFP